MALGDLEQALKLSRSGEEVWTAHADPNYESMNGMFGGWTAAVALRAVCDEADSKAVPSALTVNFVGKVEPGSDVLIRTRRVGGGRFCELLAIRTHRQRSHAGNRIHCAHRAPRYRRTP